jgi:cell division protein FtsW
MGEGEDKYSYDPFILITVLFLIGIGLIAVFSASSILAEKRFGDQYFYLRKQVMFCLLGLLLMVSVKNINYLVYKKFTYFFLGLSLALMILLFIPGVKSKIGGAYRWIRLGFISVQPSEVAKLSLAIFFAYSMSKNSHAMGTIRYGLMPHVIVAAVFIGFILPQPDLGTAAIIAVWMLVLLFIGGVNLGYIVLFSGMLAPVFYYITSLAPYRVERLLAFLNPWKDPTGSGFQIIHSLYAFGSGGLTGVGIGGSKQKLFYLPEPHTDFILPIIGEEIGFLGISILIVLFTILVFRGIKIALNAPELFGTYLALGISIMLAIQVIVNMGVVMALLPTKGLALPFVSYGGSSLVINFIGMGILMNISKKAFNY